MRQAQIWKGYKLLRNKETNAEALSSKKDTIIISMVVCEFQLINVKNIEGGKQRVLNDL